MGKLALGILAVVSVLLAGCSDPEFDTSTPEKALVAMREMVTRNRPDLLPTLIHVEAREITFDDGVSEASAIENVREKLGSMLAQLWRVSRKIRDRYPAEVEAELARAKSAARDFSFAGALADPFGFLDEQSGRVVVEDLGDGTAAVTIDGEPAFGGNLTMLETGDGWRFNIPIDLVQKTGFWPTTRHEWAVIAYMMLGIENSLGDFERELDRGGFPSLTQASERAGRLIGESVVAQSVIYASMKRPKDERSSSQPAK